MRTCTICNGTKITEILRLKNFPVFMGATEKNDFIFNDLVYGKCDDCLELQIMEFIPLDILYQDNHNVEVIGNIWKDHNEHFADFIKSSKPEVVFEIGSPSATIYLKLENESWLKKWYSIEPNPANVDNVGNKFELINGWVDNSFSFEKFKLQKPNAIVMSHVFEHLYNPREILNIFYDSLDINDEIFISIPNMNYISKNNLMPPCGLHFEHTFFTGQLNIEYLFNSCGFKIDKIKYFDNHSVFVKAIKHSKSEISIDNKMILANELCLHNFTKTIDKYKEIVTKINDEILTFDGEIYIYGSHFPAQLLLSLGLDKTKLVGCLDQSKNKIGKRLYGTDLNIFAPAILEDKSNVKVICHMGPYTNEIKNTIIGINKDIKFI